MLFRFGLPSSHPLLQQQLPWSLHQGVVELLNQHGFTGRDVVDVFRKGSLVFFKVADHVSAYDIVHKRSALKGTGISIFEVLSDREDQLYQVLVPRFWEAMDKGQKPQFYRHRLKIDGKWV